MTKAQKNEQDVTKDQLVDLLAKLDVLQTFPFNRSKPKQKKDQPRNEVEKSFITALWDDYFEITKPKPDEQKDAKKTPRKNWNVKQPKVEMPVPRAAVAEFVKVLVNPYLQPDEKVQLLADIQSIYRQQDPFNYSTIDEQGDHSMSRDDYLIRPTLMAPEDI